MNDKQHQRQLLLQQLGSKYLRHGDEHVWHGRLDLSAHHKQPLQPLPEKPVATWKSAKKPRDDHGEVALWLTATEYCDTQETLQQKIDVLGVLLLVSNKTTIYSGAGISVAAGIGQAARGSRRSSNKTTTAVPTVSHHALAALHHAGLIHEWVQQNHDGLPQKAGFPQEAINEVHGSWYDPSNPVVVYSWSLKQAELRRMKKAARTSDLVLVIGTSLGGLNADRVPFETAARSLKRGALGMVLINLQRTEHDGKATLRLFGECDDILPCLADRLLPQSESPWQPPPPMDFAAQSPRRVLVPYNAKGEPCRSSRRMWLDLRPGALVAIPRGHHNIAGARQPAHEFLAKVEEPTGRVTRWNRHTMAIELQILCNGESIGMQLGMWWVEAAQRGGADRLPVVNVEPEFNAVVEVITIDD